MERLSEIVVQAAQARMRRDRIPTVSARTPDGALIEMVHDPIAGSTSLVRWSADAWTRVPEVELAEGRKLVPLSAQNNLVEHSVIRFPSSPADYKSEAELARSIQSFIHRYVNLSARFERVATAYVLLTWLADSFNELPYLRVRGSPGTGKTRFL